MRTNVFYYCPLKKWSLYISIEKLNKVYFDFYHELYDLKEESKKNNVIRREILDFLPSHFFVAMNDKLVAPIIRMN
jgi:hypothetical protein